MTRLALCFLAALIALSISVGASGRCGSPSSLDLPITVKQGLPLVRVTLKSGDAVLIVDTGAESSIFSTAAAERLQLPRNMAYPRRVRGINGGVVSGAVELPGFAIAGVHMPNFGVLVGSLDLPKVDGIAPDGLLGADILSDFDLEMDLAHDLVRLTCGVPAPAWTRSHSPIAANRSLHNRLFFRTSLDGKNIATIIDTGAQHSLLAAEAASALGASPERLAREHVGQVRGVGTSVGVEARPYRFRRLVIGEETLTDPILLVAPVNLADADLILGADFLKSFRAWISYKSRNAFIARAP